MINQTLFCSKTLYLKKTAIILFFMFFLVSSIGCEDFDFDSIGENGRFKSEKDASGNLVILDTKTGNVELIKDEQRILITKNNETNQLQKFKSSKIPGLPVKISYLDIKYMDGLLLYRGNIKPIPEKQQNTTAVENKKNNSSNIKDRKDETFSKKQFKKFEDIWSNGSIYNSKQINFILIDNDGFKITEFKITRNDMNRTVDSNSNPTSLSFEGSQSISLRKYKAINNYTYTWILGKWNEKQENKK